MATETDQRVSDVLGETPAARLVRLTYWRGVPVAEVDDPDWGERDRVHNWRNHVPEDIRLAWATLGPEGRVIAFLCAYAAAEAEEWD